MSAPAPAVRPLRRAGGALVALVALQLTWQLSQIGPALALTAAIDLLEVALAGGAAAACLHRARLVAGRPSPGGDAGTRRRYEVLAWRFVAAGAASWCAGQAVWTWYEVVVGREVPFPSWADLGYLGFPLAAGTGAVLLARARGRLDSGLRAMLDGVLVSGALLMISWQAVLSDIVRDGDWGLPLAVSLAYPIGDLAILALVVLLVARSPADLSLKLLAAGLMTLAVADSAFVWLSASGAFATGSLVDAVWVTAFGLIALVAWAPLNDLVDDPTAGPGRAALLLPYVPVLIGLGVGVLDLWRGTPVGRV
ncbi:MAG: hypothetical protein KJ548_12910, partial [Actinobacteria bacterium]|nr:hypothetical protein [Actinomycetota bacterium]